MIKLAENRYGKSRVRVVRVKRDPRGNDFQEWSIQVLLQGDYESCFEDGDNSGVLPTDTMKNTVYSLARKSSAECIEDFAKELIDFLLSRNPQVSTAEVFATQAPWERLNIGGKPHPTAFVQPGGERHTAKVARAQNGKFCVRSGIENLVIMKTADSAFEGYIKDSLTTLPETSDRLLGTALSANWGYASGDLPFLSIGSRIREILLEVFAGHHSKSVQHTLYAMGAKVLEKIPEVNDIELVMPNKHCLLVDLSRFGQDNPNEIFVPTDEPHGYIEARLCRS